MSTWLGKAIDVGEALDIAFVRSKLNIPHVCDSDATEAFSAGREVFDVDAHCRRLDAFIARNKLEADIWSEQLLPCASCETPKRTVYFGRARWRKRSQITTSGTA